MSWLPFKSPCPHCGRDPSPTGVASLAVLYGTPVKAFIDNHGSLCAAHCAALSERFSAEENMRAYQVACVLVDQEITSRLSDNPVGYDAWLYVVMAVLGCWYGAYWFLSGLFKVLGADPFPTSYMSASESALLALTCAFSLWLFGNNTSRINRECGRYCSGCVNLSILYVPVIALVLAVKMRASDLISWYQSRQR